jgi:peroxiredoxin
MVADRWCAARATGRLEASLMRFGELKFEDLGTRFLAACSAAAVLMACGCTKSEPSADRVEAPASTDAQATGPEIEVADASDAEVPSLDVPTEPEVKHTVREETPPAPLPASAAPLPLDRLPLAELSMPKVVLSDQHAAMCKVKVGDPFPNLELPDTGGQQRSLTELYGPKLTLVVFWDGTQPTALEEISDLNRYHLPRFGGKGLAVVAVNCGDGATRAAELAKNAGASYPILVDADRQALAQVASDKLPRSYLLDPSGKVIWFDLEYSPTTRRDLAVAIRHTLGE